MINKKVQKAKESKSSDLSIIPKINKRIAHAPYGSFVRSYIFERAVVIKICDIIY